ncbi:hypothetical protein CK203_104221 [Vitis vinifera]|uniref:R13L1/DRL21-like LRR repeat region domain-containing protein n=1 Tax=Vitis vinifera TaxID=29760 RepID=A0A438FG04_VITVI|nr:hypothetical protein CK203_104221 [Vitis vinifera]
MKIVAEALQPHQDLKSLGIYHSNDIKFPNWLTTSLSQLTTLKLEGSIKCTHLPSLGKLPQLEGLDIWEWFPSSMEKVESKRRIPCCNNAMFPFIDTGEMPQARGPAGQLAPDDAAADFVHLRFSCYDFEEINTDLWVKKSPATTKPTAMAGYCLITAIPEAVLATNHWRRRPLPPWIIRHRPTRRRSSPTVVFLNVSYSSMEKPEIYRALHKQ